MAKYIVNTAVDDLVYGEIIEIDPRMFADYIEAKFISPIDEFGNRIIELDPPKPDPIFSSLAAEQFEQQAETEAPTE